MTRLPSIGGDDGNWGEILNDYLSQAHNADGSLKPVAQSNITGLGSTLGGKQNKSSLDTGVATYISNSSATATAVKQLLNTATKKSVPTFGDLYQPYSQTCIPPGKAKVEFTASGPAWLGNNVQIRWDAANTFTHSQVPVNYGTAALGAAGATGYEVIGCEYHAGSLEFKVADIEFIVTGTKFAIRYLTYAYSDAMVWIDNEPVALEQILGSDVGASGAWNWIVITFPARASTRIRFAGPIVFTSVDYDAADPVTVRPAPAPFTLGVVSDSYYELVGATDSYSRSPAPMLRSYTGFRIWSMAQATTGYLNDGQSQGAFEYIKSSFGSDARIAMLADAPIDALLVNGSINDLNSNEIDFKAAVVDYFQKVALARSDLACVVVGIEPVSFTGGTLSTASQVNTWLKDTALSQPNVVGFIDPYNEQWLTGTGATNNQRSDGNQDWLVCSDGLHPTAAGNMWYQRLVADRLAAFPSQLVGVKP